MLDHARTLLLITCLTLGGCVSPPREFRAVWTQIGWPPSDLPAPSGFSVTPAQAFSIIARTPWTLSLKHDWDIYADSRYYYVHDTFLSDSQRRAFKQGVRVDGRTGKIVNR